MFITFIGGKFILENWVFGFVAAVSVGILNGAGFWLLYRREKMSRAAVICQVRTMLCDVVNNKLAVISLAAHLPQSTDAEQASRNLQLIDESVKEISESVSNLSEASLDDWRKKYADVQCVKSPSSEPRLKRRRRLIGASQSRPPRAQP